MSDREAAIDSGYAVGASGIVFSIVVLTTLILVICVYKAYRTTFQRLILYFIVISFLCEVTFALQIAVNYEIQIWICVPIIYFYLYFPLAFHVYLTVVTNCTFLLTLRLLKGKTNLWHGGKIVESICIALTIAIPVACLWLPIKDGAFEALNCNQSNLTQDWNDWNKDDIVINLIILIMCADVILVCIVLCCCICFIRRRVQNHQTLVLLKNLLYYTGMNATVMSVNLLTVIYCFYRYNVESKHLYFSPTLSDTINIIIGVVLPLIIFILVIFQSALSIQTTKSQSSRQSVDYVGHGRDADDECPTNPTSYPINQPSHTYFSIPYTGAFTKVSSSGSEEEQTPLIRKNNDD